MPEREGERERAERESEREKKVGERELEIQKCLYRNEGIFINIC